ncbi:MAG: hypothetical protein ACJAZ9_000552 [Neolewinella sp.]|jgi:hypothetical protein
MLAELDNILPTLNNRSAEDVAKAVRNWQSQMRINIDNMVQTGGNLGAVPVPALIFN